MLGERDFSRIRLGQVHRWRGMHSLIGAGTVAAALFAAAGTAQAQSQACMGGYRMIKGEVPILCERLVPPHASYAQLREPFHGGSLAPAPANTARNITTKTMTSEGTSCVGGYTWRATPANGWTLPMQCD